MKKSRTLLITLALAATVVFAVGAGLRLMMNEPPQWWNPPDAEHEDVMVLADRTEYRLVEEAQRIREEGEVWQFRIRENQINAWLAARLPKWIAHDQNLEWPETLGLVQVMLAPDHVTAAVEINPRGTRRIVSILIDLQQNEGMVHATIEKIVVGRVPVPWTVAELLERDFFEAAQSAIAAALYGGVGFPGEEIEVVGGPYSETEGDDAQPLGADPDVTESEVPDRETLRSLHVPARFRLADGRIVELLGLKLEQAAVVIRCRTISEK